MSKKQQNTPNSAETLRAQLETLRADIAAAKAAKLAEIEAYKAAQMELLAAEQAPMLAEAVEIQKQLLAAQFLEKYGFSVDETFIYPREENPNRTYTVHFESDANGTVKMYRLRQREAGSKTETKVLIKLEFDALQKVENKG